MNRKYVDELYEAVVANDYIKVLRYLRLGADINEPSKNGLSALGAACHLGDLRTCEALLNKESHIKSEKPSKKMCLDLIGNEQHRRNIGYFIVRKDLDQNDDNNFDDFTPEGNKNS